jgi:hypothetical protein
VVRQYNDLTNDPLYGLSVASLITREGRQHGINPGVILATLEKESSAITSTSPLSDAVHMWVLGYGWNDTMAACGYNLSDAQARAVAFGGVGQQIAYAMSFFQTKYNLYINSYPDPFTTVDGATIRATSPATRALYVYTPYVYNGNYNFWLLFNAWFISGSRRFSREATLIKVVGGSEVYAYWPLMNKRWYVARDRDLDAWGIQNRTISEVSEGQMAAITFGGRLTRLVKRERDDAVYYFEGGTKYHVKTDKMFPLYSMTWSELTTLDDTMLDQAPTGPPLGVLARSISRPEVYLLTYGRKYYIPSEALLRNWGYTWSDISVVPQPVIDGAANGDSLDLLAQVEGGSQVYLVSNGKRLYIPSQAVLTAWNLNFGMVKHVGLEIGYVVDEGPTLGRVAKGSGSEVYYIENGKKRHVTSEARLRRVGLSLSSVVTVSDMLLSRLPTGSRL